MAPSRAGHTNNTRDRVLLQLPFYAGLPFAETVGLDLDDIHLSARKGTLRINGKGERRRELPIHPQLPECSIRQVLLFHRIGQIPERTQTGLR